MDLSQLKRIQAKLNQITEGKVANLLKEEILNNSDEIVSLVRERWRKGLRPSGDIIGNYRNFSYEMEKRSRNPLAGGTVDLIDTGALNRGLVVNSLADSVFNIFSTDEKAVDIASKYGLDVYGLTREEEQEVLLEASSRVYIELFNFVGL
jgi:hypothetical protein